MPAMTTQCPSGHDIRTAADRDGQGYCRKCRSDSQRRRRRAQKVALDVFRLFEEAGVKFENDGVPIAAEDVARQFVELYPLD